MPDRYIQHEIDAKKITAHIISALSYCHERLNIAHNDVHEQNVLLWLDDNRRVVRAKLADFGMAQYISPPTIDERLDIMDMKKIIVALFGPRSVYIPRGPHMTVDKAQALLPNTPLLAIDLMLRLHNAEISMRQALRHPWVVELRDTLEQPGPLVNTQMTTYVSVATSIAISCAIISSTMLVQVQHDSGRIVPTDLVDQLPAPGEQPLPSVLSRRAARSIERSDTRVFDQLRQERQLAASQAYRQSEVAADYPPASTRREQLPYVGDAVLLMITADDRITDVLSGDGQACASDRERLPGRTS